MRVYAHKLHLYTHFKTELWNNILKTYFKKQTTLVHLLQIARRYLKSFNDWPVKYYFWYVISKWIEFSCLYISHWHYSIRTSGYKVQMNLSIFCFERKVHLFLQECLFKIKTELCYFMFGLSAFLIKEQAELLTAFFVTDSSLTYKGYNIWVLLYTFCHWFKFDIQRLQHLGTALHNYTTSNS